MGAAFFVRCCCCCNSFIHVYLLFDTISLYTAHIENDYVCKVVDSVYLISDGIHYHGCLLGTNDINRNSALLT
jgi:hypothetical protein